LYFLVLRLGGCVIDFAPQGSPPIPIIGEGALCSGASARFAGEFYGGLLLILSGS